MQKELVIIEMMWSPSPRITTAIAAIFKVYPDVATAIIQHHQDMFLPANRSFANHPDDPHEHEVHWHQYGIITHCRRFQRCLERDVPNYLQTWGIWREAQKTLLAEIDGLSKWDLLQITAVLHDVGKFAARRPGKGFKDHEKLSGQLLRTTMKPLLKEHGFTEDQIEYIAATAELHYELGKLRRKAKRTGYTMAFTESYVFKEGIKEIQTMHPEFSLEIGLLFLPDSMSKTAIAATGDTDTEIASEREPLERKLAEANINPILITAALQLPVNIRVAEVYLKYWAMYRKKTMLWLALDAKSRQALRTAFRRNISVSFIIMSP